MLNQILALESAVMSTTIMFIILGLSFVLLGIKIFNIIKLQRFYRKSVKLIGLRPKNWATIITSMFLFPSFIIMIIYTSAFNPIPESFCLTAVLLLFTVTVVLMSFTKCAVISTGVITSTRFIPWSEVYDYYINREKCSVIFSCNMKGGLSLVGTSFPLSFDRRDIDNLIKILDSNKNKFSDNMVVR